MSDFKRLKRAVKSFMPKLGKKRSHYYDHGDARLMIADLGLQMSPQVLDYLTNSDEVLEDFVNGIYFLEDDIDRDDLIVEPTVINIEYEPRVYVEEGKVEFTVKYRREEIVFAEYELPEGLEPTPPADEISL